MRRHDTRTRKRVIVDVRSSRNLYTNRIVAPYRPFATNPSETIQTSSRNRVFALCSQTRHLPLQRVNTSTQAFIDAPKTPFDAIAESTLALRRSINRHSTWNGSMAEIWHFCHVRLVLVAVNLPSRNMGL